MQDTVILVLMCYILYSRYTYFHKAQVGNESHVSNFHASITSIIYLSFQANPLVYTDFSDKGKTCRDFTT